MLSAEKNTLLTQVGAGSPMGELLRRYWHPVAPAKELRDRRVKPVRLLGEDLVLFRRTGGGYGLVSRSCPHRGTDLSVGWVEEDVLVCPYHGWAFDSAGRCARQPFEEMGPAGGFRDKVGVAAYPTATLGGLVWAYLGPEPAPLLPKFEQFGWSHGFVEIVMTELPCNWFQCHENAVDPVHFEWLHTNGNAVRVNPDAPVYAPRHQNIGFSEFEFGFINQREVQTEYDPSGSFARSSQLTDGGILCLWPYSLASGNTFEFRVPVDDETTLNITWQYSVLPCDVQAAMPECDDTPFWYGPLRGSDGRIIVSHTGNQDFAAWIGQGVIADRTREQLGRSDKGITLLRRRFLEAIETVADGGDPPGIVRDQERHTIELPLLNKSIYTEGVPRRTFEAKLAARRKSRLYGIGGYFAVQAGRPAELTEAYERAARISPGAASDQEPEA